MVDTFTQYEQAPFTVTLDEGFVVRAEKILRFLPKKRVVAKAIWKEKEVVLKVFFHGRAKKHLAREVAGNQQLEKAGVPVPKVLYSGHLAEQACFVIIYEYLSDGHNLNDLSKTPESSGLLHNAVDLLSKMHSKGLRQKDLHLENFFVSRAVMYVLDAGSVTAARKAVSVRTALKDLARVVALFAVKDFMVVREVLNIYLGVRKLAYKASFFGRLIKLVKSVFKKEKKNYLSKVFRDCTKVKRIKSFSRLLLCERKYYSESLQQYLDNLDENLKHPEEVLKSGNTCTVFRCKVGEQDLVVKRYNIKGFWHGVKRLLQKSRAEKCWYNSHLLELLNIATPQPVAMIERRFGLFKREAYYISEYLPGELCDTYFTKMVLFDDKRDQVKATSKKVIALLQSLAENHLSHGDLKANNILLVGGEPYLLDLDAMADYKQVHAFKRHFNHDIERFMRNWCDNPVALELFSCLIIKE